MPWWSLLLIGILISGIVAYLLLYSAAGLLKWNGRAQKPEEAPTAIVLGAYTDGFRPSPTLRRRLRAALLLYRTGTVASFIVSGGQGEDESVTESSAMKRFLVLNGVPQTLIYEERHSVDTWENLRNSQRVMERMDFSSAVVVTSDYHLPRALAVARHLDMNVTGFAARTGSSEFGFALREVAANIMYTLRGRAQFP